FQAEDGIRDPLVTGVQTCALPIWVPLSPEFKPARVRPPAPTGLSEKTTVSASRRYPARGVVGRSYPTACHASPSVFVFICGLTEIGRASCRERVWMSGQEV